MKSIIKTRCSFIAVALGCLALSQTTQAVNPPPDGGYANFTTAEGQKALFSLTTGAANTAIGWSALLTNAAGSFNTATGAGALLFNTADDNTAFGAAALLFNTTGADNTAVGGSALQHNTTGGFNTANGGFALVSNTTGNSNTANGRSALFNNTTGNSNTALGVAALFSNTTGDANTAVGWYSLLNNTGSNNTANGFAALGGNTTGSQNTANGALALSSNITGFNNTAIGASALHSNTTGDFNTAVGEHAGSSVTGSGNVCIGGDVDGVSGVDNTTWIRNVYASVASGRAVYVNSDNKIGTLSSSRRYKDEISSMAKASEAILSLRPVSFRYKKEVNPTRSLSFGLIAEEVAQVDPDLVTLDRDGRPETVRYEAVNAMLLNEFLKEHNKVEKLESTVANLVATMKEQAAQIQKVSAELESTKHSQQVGLNNR